MREGYAESDALVLADKEFDIVGTRTHYGTFAWYWNRREKDLQAQ